MCVSAYVSVGTVPWEARREGLSPLELELQLVVSHSK